jgi:hypothetical protein
MTSGFAAAPPGPPIVPAAPPLEQPIKRGNTKLKNRQVTIRSNMEKGNVLRDVPILPETA